MKNKGSAFYIWFLLFLFQTLTLACAKLSTPEEMAAALTGSTGANKLNVSGPVTASPNQCLPLILTLQNSSGQAMLATESMQFNFIGMGTNVFSDDACAVPQTLPLAWSVGKNSAVVYVKPSLTQIYTLLVNEVDQKVTGAYQIISVSNGSTTTEELRLAVSGPTTLLAGQCKAYVVALQNASGSSRTRTSATTLNLSGAGSGQFFDNNNCSAGAVTSLNLPSGTSLKGFSYRNNSAENVLLVADTAISGLSSGFLSVQVESSAAYQPSQLAMTGPSAVTAGACSAPAQLKVLDSYGTPTIASNNIPVTLSGNLGFTAYADSGCLTPLVTPQIPAGSSSINFYFQTSAGGTLSIVADDGAALLDTSLAVTSTASIGGSASKIAVVGPTTITAGTCSSAFLVKTQDGSNVDYAVSGATTINLTGKGSGDFYSDGACTTIISSLNFSSGDSTKAFYYKTNAVGSLVFNADDPGALVPGSQSVNVNPGVATQLTLAGPTPINVGDCRAYVVTSKDANGFSSPVSSSTPVDLTGSGAGAFYSDSSCTNATTSVNINSGQTNAVFYMKPSSAGLRSLSADDLESLTAGVLAVSVSALPATKMALSHPVLRAGTCTAITATIRDSLDGSVSVSSNTSVGLTATNGAFYSDAGCSTSITTTTVTTGNSSSAIYYRHTMAETVTLGAASTGLTADSWTVAVSAGNPATLTLAGTSPISAGACVPLTVSVKDTHGNASNVTSSTLLTFSGAGAGKFSNQGDCSTVNSTMTLSSGNNQTGIYYLNNSAEAVTLSVAASGLTTGTLPMTINPTGATKTKWTLASSTSAGTCLTGSLQVQDALSNPVVQGSNRNIDLTGLNSASVHNSADCTGGSVTTLTVLTGQSSVSFSIRDNTAESLTLSAASSGLTTVNHALLINPGAVHHITLAGPSTTLASECTAYDLRIEDSLNNLSNVGTSTTVNFTGLGSAKFYSDAACASQISSTIFSSGTSQKTLYLKDNVAEALTITADDSGALVAGNKAMTVQNQAAVQLAITGASSAAAQVCSTFTVKIQDSLGNNVVQGANFIVDLAGKGNGQFYSDAGCTTLASQITISSGASSAVFRFKSNVAESLTFTAQNSGSGLLDGTKNFVNQALSPSKLTMSGLASLAADSCGGYSITVQDSLNNFSAVGSSKNILFSGAGTGSFYSDSNCSISTSGLTLTSSQTSASVYYKASSAQSVTLTVDDTGSPDLTAASVAVNITGGGGGGGNTGPAIGFSEASRTIAESQGEFALIVQMSATSAQDVSVSYAVSGTAGRPADHNLSAGSLTIPAGQTTAEIRFLVYDDPIVDANETIIVTLQSPVNGQLGTVSSTTLTIQDNDAGGGGLSLTQADRPWGIEDKTMATSGSSTCVINKGALYCWGYNAYGQLGDGTTTNRSFPQLVPGMTSGVSKVVMPRYNDTYDHVCAIKNGALFCWGYNGSGQLGDGTTTQRNSPTAVLGMASGVTDVEVSPAGHQYSSSCAIKSRSLYCWGYNTTGQLGDGTGTQRNSPVQVLNMDTSVTAVKLGGGYYSGDGQTYGYACAIKAGALYCWGNGGNSQLGTGTGTNYTPNLVTGMNTGVSDISLSSSKYAGQDHTCAIKLGALYCWGYNNVYQLGDGTTTARSTPIIPTGMSSGVTKVSVTNSYTSTAIAYTCAVKSGAAYCWGSNDYGQLGNGGASSPLVVTNMSSGVTDILTNSHGSYGTTCGIKSGSLYCWGYNGSGQLGDGTSTNRSTPVQVLGMTNSVQGIATAGYSSGGTICAIQAGTFKCWGYNVFSQVGDGTTNNLLTARALKLPENLDTGVTKIVSSTSTTCLIRNAALYCSGNNSSGQLGIGGTSNSAAFTLVPGFSSGVTDVAIAQNSGTVCAVRSGAAFCWGANTYGQVGDGTTTNRNSPTAVISLSSNVSKIFVHDTHSCAIFAGGLYCWGYGGNGQLGNGSNSSSSAPVAVTGLSSGVTDVSLGGMSTTGTTCAIATGALYCWGYNGYSQIGDGTTTSRNTPTAVTNMGSGVTKVSTYNGDGNYHYTCAIKSGAAFCWGYGSSYGNLGNGSLVDRSTPFAVTGLGANVTDIVTAGVSTQTYTCAIQSGALFCWGYNAYGQLGDSSSTNRNIPTAVNGMASGVTKVTASIISYGTTCAIRSGALYCWGYGGNGQIGDNGGTNRYVPVAVTSMTTSVTDMIVSGNTSYGKACGIQSGALSCWGSNQYMDLGILTSSSNVPIVSKAITSVGFDNILHTLPYRPSAKVESGSTHTCALLNQKVFCWGANSSGQLGDGTTAASTSAVQVPGITDAEQLTVGDSHNCVIRVDRKLYCWGSNSSGQLGLGDTTDRTSPTQVGTNDWRMVDAGGLFTCGDSSGLYCWGDNSFGQLGIGTTVSSSVPVSTNLDVYELSVGAKTVCAAPWNGGGKSYGLYCWGDNSAGQVGDNTSNNIRSSVTTASTTASYLSVSVGSDHACGIKEDQTAQCWGYNSSGQLGDATTTSRRVPTAVSSLTGVKELVAGSAHTCALSTVGEMSCWGSNSAGQLGIGASTAKTTPQLISGYTGLVSIGVGDQNSCLIRATGDVLCAGQNSSGQLGIGNTTNRTIPDYVQGLTP